MIFVPPEEDMNSFVNRPLPYRDGYPMLPNLMARSAMCSALAPRQDRQPDYQHGAFRIESLKGTSITQLAGQRLSQADLDTWLLVTEEFALTEMEYGGVVDEIEVRLSDLVEATEKSGGGKNKNNLVATLKHLDQARYVIHKDGFDKVIELRLLELVEISEKHCVVGLPAASRQLFDYGFAGVNKTERKSLSPLGRWLHAHYSSHTSRPLPVGVALISLLSGHRTMAANLCMQRTKRAHRSDGLASAFAQKLERELAQLEHVTGWSCRLVNGKVHVAKPTKGIGGNAATTSEPIDESNGEI